MRTRTCSNMNEVVDEMVEDIDLSGYLRSGLGNEFLDHYVSR